MFDKLVESAKQKQGRRAKRLFLITCMIYAIALTSFGVATIVGFSPALADEFEMFSDLVPPPPPAGNIQPPPKQPVFKSIPDHGFVEPKIVVDIPEPDEWLNHRPKALVLIGPHWTGPGRDGIASSLPDMKDAPPPPPPPPPAAKPAATPSQEQVVRLTSVLTQGRALRRVQPPYPTIAKYARVQGSVQIQIGISETGEVSEATVISGHPMLRDVALQAARQWLFKPTELNGRPTRAIGVITFNFTLN